MLDRMAAYFQVRPQAFTAWVCLGGVVYLVVLEALAELLQ